MRGFFAYNSHLFNFRAVLYGGCMKKFCMASLLRLFINTSQSELTTQSLLGANNVGWRGLCYLLHFSDQHCSYFQSFINFRSYNFSQIFLLLPQFTDCSNDIKAWSLQNPQFDTLQDYQKLLVKRQNVLIWTV